MTKPHPGKPKPQRKTRREYRTEKAAADAARAKLRPSHQRIAEFMNPLPVAVQKTCVGKLLAASQAGSVYRDDPQEPSRIVRIVCQSLGDILHGHQPADRDALLQQTVDDYGTPDLPSASERAIIAKLNRSRKRKRF